MKEVTEDVAELRRQFMANHTLEERLEGIPPEQRLVGLSPEQRLAGLSPEQRAELIELLLKG